MKFLRNGLELNDTGGGFRPAAIDEREGMSERSKFRVWDTEERCYLSDYGPAWFNLMSNGEVVTGVEDMPDMPAHKDRYIVEFRIGLKDKNGRAEYFNDVVKIKDSFGERVGVITFDEKRWTICIEYPDGSATFGGRDLLERCEVVGNVHQHLGFQEATQ